MPKKELPATDESKKPKPKKTRRGRGEGTIQKRDNGTWYAQVSTGEIKNGVRERITVSAKTKSEVQEELLGLQNKKAAGVLGSRTSQTVKDFFTHWIEHTVKETVSAGTFDRYESNMKLWIVPHIGHIELPKLKAHHIDTVMAAMVDAKRAGQTRCGVRDVLSCGLDYAVLRGLISQNVCDTVPRARFTQKEIRPLNQTQCNAFLKACPKERLGPMWATLALTGARLGEVLALKPSDLNLSARKLTIQRTQARTGKDWIIKVPKTAAARRTITLSKGNVKILADWLRAREKEGNAKSDWLFPSLDGSMPIRSAEPASSFKRIHKASGVPPIRQHDLRHTHATLLLQANEPVKVVSERLGHASILITLKIYAHVLPDMQFAAADTLDRLFG